jgi:hypothetical protein
MVEILYSHVWNGTVRHIETILRRGERGDKWMMEGVNLRYIVSTFINVPMYPLYNNNNKN